jgi:hypothetical protein
MLAPPVVALTGDCHGRILLSSEELRKLDFTYLSIGRPDVVPSELNRHANDAAAA